MSDIYPDPASPQDSLDTVVEPTKKPFNWKVVVVSLAATMIAAACLGGGYYLGQQSGSHVSEVNSTPTPTQAASNSPTPIASTAPTPSSNPYAGWKTYTGKAINFTIKYPSDHKLEMDESQSQYALSSGAITNSRGQTVLSLEVTPWHMSAVTDEELQAYIDQNVTQAIPLATIPDARFEKRDGVNGQPDYWGAVVSYRGQMTNPLWITIPHNTPDMNMAKLIVGSISGPDYLLSPILKVGGN